MKKGQILNILLNMPKLKKIPDQCHSYEEIRNRTTSSRATVWIVDTDGGFRYHHVNHQTSLAVLGPYIPQQLPGNAPVGAGTTNIQCLCGSLGDHDHCQLSELALRVHDKDDEEECDAFTKLQGLIDR